MAGVRGARRPRGVALRGRRRRLARLRGRPARHRGRRPRGHARPRRPARGGRGAHEPGPGRACSTGCRARRAATGSSATAASRARTTAAGSRRRRCCTPTRWSPWWGGRSDDPRLDAVEVQVGDELSEFYVFLAMVGVVLVTVPLLSLGGAAARLGVARRNERLAALRLVGATGRQVLGLAGDRGAGRGRGGGAGRRGGVRRAARAGGPGAVPGRRSRRRPLARGRRGWPPSPAWCSCSPA